MVFGVNVNDFWDSLSRVAKISLIGGVVFILSVTAALAFWLLRVDYQVLFSDLRAQDSAVMVAELDKLKIPYKISDSGTSILVEKDLVHSTRMKLLGKDLPLHGAVGFELFNNSDFGMTEFAQKINYQRALQGEITRTILSFDEIKDVRVHIALPEDGLFKRATSKAKAAITIALKPGSKLRNEQILGIQRLVAAAVPGIVAQDVTIVDQQGVALSRASAQGENDVVTGQLELKKDTETLLAKKINEVLSKTFGAEHVTASVDVVLNMDQIRVTTEDVLPSPAAAGQAATGVIVRERESVRDMAAPLDAVSGQQSVKTGANMREVDYQVGRRVEQIVSQPGAIKHINAVAVVNHALDAQQIEQLKSLVSAAVGAIPERGDTVVVQSAASLQGAPNVQQAKQPAESNNAAISNNSASLDAVMLGKPGATLSATVYVLVLFLVFVIALVMGVALARSKRNGQPKPLSEEERLAALEKIDAWMSGNELDSTDKVPSKFHHGA